jgi:hypothetical protein
MKKRSISISLCMLFVVGTALAMPDPDSYSIDALSPSGNDPADVLNIGMSVQVPRGNLGLVAGDELDGLSSGNDGVQWSNIVYFSVDRNSQGIAGPWTPLAMDVFSQAFRNQQAGDMFVTTDVAGMGVTPQGINMLYNNQSLYGEIPLFGWMVDNTGNPQDNLDAVAFEEFDLTGNGVQDRPVYFSLGAGSPSLAAGGFNAADILISPAVGIINVFAAAGQIGLTVDDDLDALALLDLNQDGTASVGDMGLFSLAPGSPTLAALGASPADLFFTSFNGASAVRYQAVSLGLLPEDNIDALEVQIPEPATIALLALGAIALRRRE